MVRKIEPYFLLILEYLIANRTSLHPLLLISRMFYQATVSDALWNRLEIGLFDSGFEGLGYDGQEMDEWNNCRLEAGLPLFNIVK